jgi:TIR domain
MANKYAGDISPNNGKYLMPLNRHSYEPMLHTHIGTSGYLFADKARNVKKQSDKSFISNNNIWEQIIFNNMYRTGANIKLHSFFLLDWLPRSPGLFHTNAGRNARQEAKHFVYSKKKDITVYDPHGKFSMLEGGYGNIRLNPISLQNEPYYFICATDNGVCHEGFPIAVPAMLYDTIIDEISERGSIVKDVIGKLRNVPVDIDNLYSGYKHVPKVYLQVSDLLEAKFPKRRSTQDLSVTVASSFISSYEGPSKIYATYVGFDPSKKNELDDSVEWMEKKYVEGMYKGKILTDFDQTTNHFDNAPFSLKKVMNLEVDPSDIESVATELGHSGNDVLTIQTEIRKHKKAAAKLLPPTIFISYNHEDVAIAKKIQKKFEAAGFKVIRDEENIEEGEKIADFIKRSILQSKFTLSIISKNSLQSAWVSVETIMTAYSEILLQRKFLPVYIDNDFLDIHFVPNTTDKIDKEMREVRRLMNKQLNKDRGTQDLHERWNSLRKLKENLSEFVAKLRELKCTNLSGTTFSRGMEKLINQIKKDKLEII